MLSCDDLIISVGLSYLSLTVSYAESRGKPIFVVSLPNRLISFLCARHHRTGSSWSQVLRSRFASCAIVSVYQLSKSIHILINARRGNMLSRVPVPSSKS